MDFIQPPHAFVQKRAVANGTETHANKLPRTACVQGELVQGSGISQGFKHFVHVPTGSEVANERYFARLRDATLSYFDFARFSGPEGCYFKFASCANRVQRQRPRISNPPNRASNRAKSKKLIATFSRGGLFISFSLFGGIRGLCAFAFRKGSGKFPARFFGFTAWSIPAGTGPFCHRFAS